MEDGDTGIDPVVLTETLDEVSNKVSNVIEAYNTMETTLKEFLESYQTVIKYNDQELVDERSKKRLEIIDGKKKWAYAKTYAHVKEIGEPSNLVTIFSNVTAIITAVGDYSTRITRNIKKAKEDLDFIDNVYNAAVDEISDSDSSGGNSGGGGNSGSGGSSGGGGNSGSGGNSNSYGYTSLGTVGQVASNFIAKPFEDSSTGENSAIDKVKQTATDSISNTFKDSSTEKKSSVEKNVDNIISIDNTSDSSLSTSSDASIQTAEETQKQVTDAIVTPVDTATGSEYEAIPKTGLEGKKSSNVQLIPIAVGAALGAAGVTAKKLQKKDSKDDEKDNKDKD